MGVLGRIPPKDIAPVNEDTQTLPHRRQSRTLEYQTDSTLDTPTRAKKTPVNKKQKYIRYLEALSKPHATMTTCSNAKLQISYTPSQSGEAHGPFQSPRLKYGLHKAATRPSDHTTIEYQVTRLKYKLNQRFSGKRTITTLRNP